jgi:hypothetical protein
MFRSWHKVALSGNFPERFLLATLAVLTPGPRLAGTPSEGERIDRLKPSYAICNQKWLRMEVGGMFAEGFPPAMCAKDPGTLSAEQGTK